MERDGSGFNLSLSFAFALPRKREREREASDERAYPSAYSPVRAADSDKSLIEFEPPAFSLGTALNSIGSVQFGAAEAKARSLCPLSFASAETKLN